MNYIWTDTNQTCFENLKYQLCENHLAFYDTDKSLELHTDTSNYAVGAVLIQYDENNEKQPIAFILRASNNREIRYSVTEKEALALVWAVDKLHIYLYRKNFHTFVDHQPLKHIFKPRSKLNAKFFRWQLHLQNYNFTVPCQKGTEKIADFLSQIRHEEGSNNVHYKNLINEYCNFILSQAIPKTLSLAEIQEHKKLDNTLNFVVEALKCNNWESDEVQRYKQIRNELTEHNSILIREKKIVLPQSLRKKAIEIAYQGHLGICKVKSLLREKVYWPGLDADVNEFISRCIPCQANSRIPPPEPVKM